MNVSVEIAVLIWLGIAAVGALLFRYAYKQYIPPSIDSGTKQSEYLAMPDEVESDMDAFVRSALLVSQNAEDKERVEAKSSKVIKTDAALSSKASPKKARSNRFAIVSILSFTVLAIFVVLAIGFFDREESRATTDERSGVITFYRTENHHRLITSSNMDLSVSDYDYLLNYIKKKYPSFNLKASGLSLPTTSSKKRTWVDDFNESPPMMEIYLSGLEKDAGVSSTFAVLHVDDSGNLEGFDFSRDQEFSDRSGFTYTVIYPFMTDTTTLMPPSDDGTEYYGECIGLIRERYAPSDEWYWVIAWMEHDAEPSEETDSESAAEGGTEGETAEPDAIDVTETRRNALIGFLNRLHESEAYSQLDREVLLNAYTGLADGERIGDIVDWN